MIARHCVVLGYQQDLLASLDAVGILVSVLLEHRESAKLLACPVDLHETVIVQSTRSVESVLQGLCRRKSQTPIDAVIAAGELSVVAGAVVGELLDAKSLSVPVALHCRDKSLQKAAWRHDGITTARAAVLTGPIDNMDADSILDAAGLALPVIVKPIDEAGTIGVRRIASLPELMCALEETQPLLVEEFIDLPEWHFDVVVEAGVVTHLMVSRYVDPLLMTKSDAPVRSLTLRVDQTGDRFDSARKFTTRSLAALGVSAGVFHFEVFGNRSTEGYIAGELALRPGGGLIPRVAMRVLGVDLWAAHGALIVGTPVHSQEVEMPECLGFASLPTLARQANRFEVSQLATWDGVLDVLARQSVGELMGDMRDTVGNNLGYVSVEADGPAQVVERLDHIISSVADHHDRPRRRRA